MPLREITPEDRKRALVRMLLETWESYGRKDEPLLMVDDKGEIEGICPRHSDLSD